VNRLNRTEFALAKELSNIANSDIAVYCLLTDIIKVWGCFAMEIMGVESSSRQK
jgi:hypothetical protein